ncbi:MAG: hypothetical protein Q7T04_04960 [Dehalococcoidia bacterium]|nr:hypothetical protein [Dehalococcoidia bacterium]
MKVCIYARVLAVKPNWYDRFIVPEKELNQPSIHGGVFLPDIKTAVLEGKPIDAMNQKKLDNQASGSVEFGIHISYGVTTKWHIFPSVFTKTISGIT